MQHFPVRVRCADEVACDPTNIISVACNYFKEVCCPHFFFFLPRWARVSKLFILVGVIVGVILLASFDFLESTRQVNGFPLCPLGGDVCALVITGLRGVSIVCCSIFCVYEFLPPNAPICQLESCGAHAALQPVTLACCAKRKIFFQSFFLVSRPVQYLAAGLERRARLRRRARLVR